MSPSEVDRELVRRHLLALDQALQNLRRHQGRAVEELARDRDELWTVERGLQLCAQNALDVATHLAASRGRDVPSYATAIDQLAELEILPRDFAARFRSIAGFRNVVVHAYLEGDVALVHRLLNERLEDFAEFARSVERALGTRSRSEGA